MNEIQHYLNTGNCSNKQYICPQNDANSTENKSCWEPIFGGVHDRFKTYEKCTLVYSGEDGRLVAYMATKYVPKGVEITNREFWQPMNVTGYADDNIIIISDRNVTGQLISYTLEEVLPTIAEVSRKPGAILSFFTLENGPHWEIYQYRLSSTSTTNWENPNNWRSLYTISNKFVGWYNSLEDLNKQYIGEYEGKYAIVGETFRDAIVYEGVSNGWESTGNNIFQKFLNDLIINIEDKKIDLNFLQKATLRTFLCGEEPLDCSEYGGSCSNCGGGGDGSVTSVGLTAPEQFSVENSPITTAGNINLKLKSEYTIPTKEDVNKGKTAYSWGNHADAGYITELPDWMKGDKPQYTLDELGIKEPLKSINNIGQNPDSENSILIFKNGSWGYSTSSGGGIISWRPIKVNGEFKLNDSVNALNIEQGDGILLQYNEGTKSIRINNTGVSQGSTIYFEPAFKSTNSLTPAPGKPNVSFPNGNDGWGRSTSNSDGRSFVWMTMRQINGNVIGEWETPWLITGPQGLQGKDGSNIQFVYCRTASGNTPTLQHKAINTSEYQGDNYIPQSNSQDYNWSGIPQGITENFKYEWIAVRIKNSEGVWGEYSSPVIWSRWGEKGIDGSNMEYIFYASQSINNPPTGTYNDPTGWTYYSGFQEDNYIGPAGSQWQNNPIDLSTSEYGKGSAEWVSKRIKGTDGWEAFSTPALWAYIGQDGIVNGFTFDITPDSSLCKLDKDGTTLDKNFTVETKLYRNGLPISDYTILDLDSTNKITKDGVPISDDITLHIDNEHKTASISIPPGLQDYDNSVLRVPIRVCFDIAEPGEEASIQYRTEIFQIFFFQSENNTISLNTNYPVIKLDHYRQNSNPNELEVFAMIGDQKILPADDSDEYVFKYQYISNDSNHSYNIENLETNSINIQNGGGRASWIVSLAVFLYKTDGNEEKLLLQQILPYVVDGAPAISPINYVIQPLSSDLTVTEKEVNGNTSKYIDGTLKFKAVYMQEGNVTPIEDYYPLGGQNLINEKVYVKVEIGGIQYNLTSNNYDQESGEWTVIISDQAFDTISYSNIKIVSPVTTLASTIIPFIIKGQKGDPGIVQGLNSVVMRLFDYNPNDTQQTFYDGTVPNDAGIKYLDILRYPSYDSENNYNPTGGTYYRLKPGALSSIGHPLIKNGDINTDDWIPFASQTDSAAFQTLIADYLYANNITAKDIVITNNQQKPEAGITGGESVIVNENDEEVEGKDSVRIWAGNPTVGNNTNLTNCPFYVTKEGVMHANNGVFSGEVNGITGSFKSLQCKNDNGQVSGTMSFSTDDLSHATIKIEGCDIIQTGKYNNDGRDVAFRGVNVWASGTIGSAARNTILITESGNSSIPSTVQYIITVPSYTMGRTALYQEITYSYTPQIDSNGIYTIPLMHYSGVNDNLINVPFDTVIIIGKSQSGDISYNFTSAGLGKQITVVNASTSSYINLITHSTNKVKLNSNSGCIMTFVRSHYLGTSSSLGKGWFVVGSFANI